MSTVPPTEPVYGPGDWILLAGPTTWMLVDQPLDDWSVPAYWPLIRDGAEVDDLLDAIITAGIRKVAGFALLRMSLEDPDRTRSARVVVRGGGVARVVMPTGHPLVVTASRAQTWVDQVFDDLPPCIDLLSGEEHDELVDDAPEMPLTSGIVRASRVRVGGPLSEGPGRRPAEQLAGIGHSSAPSPSGPARNDGSLDGPSVAPTHADGAGAAPPGPLVRPAPVASIPQSTPSGVAAVTAHNRATADNRTTAASRNNTLMTGASTEDDENYDDLFIHTTMQSQLDEAVRSAAPGGPGSGDDHERADRTSDTTAWPSEPDGVGSPVAEVEDTDPAETAQPGPMHALESGVAPPPPGVPPPPPGVRPPPIVSAPASVAVLGIVPPPPGVPLPSLGPVTYTPAGMRPMPTGTGSSPAPPRPAPGHSRPPELGQHPAGATQSRAQLLALSGVPVLAATCPDKHLSPGYSSTCRVCGKPIPPQTPVEVARPPLGGLRLPSGDVVILDRGVVLGREPTKEVVKDRPHRIKLDSPDSDVSRNHAEISLDGWHVVITDLDSLNGTVVTRPGMDPERLRAHDPQVIEPGSIITLADVVSLRFEAT